MSVWCGAASVKSGLRQSKERVWMAVFTVRCRMAAGIARMDEMMNSGKRDERFDQYGAAPSTDTGVPSRGMHVVASLPSSPLACRLQQVPRPSFRLRLVRRIIGCGIATMGWTGARWNALAALRQKNPVGGP
jgi:hypothetical protein